MFMFERTIKFDTITQVQKFVTTISGIQADFDLIHGRYIIDGKSIMGIFSLDLSHPLLLRVHTEDNMIESYIDKELKELELV